MPDFGKILYEHKQLHEDSCAAAGMELILKLHEKVAPDWFDFQNEYGNENIQFKRLDRLTPYGINATADHLGKDDLARLLVVETQAGGFPLVCLPGSWIYNVQGGPKGFHVWTAITNDNSFMLVAGGYKKDGHDVVKSFDELMNRIHEYQPDYQIHHVCYTIS